MSIETPPSVPHARSRARALLFVVAAAAAVLAWFLLQPLDLAVSGLFYRAGSGFWLNQLGIVQLVYRGTLGFVVAAIGLLAAAFFYSMLPTSKWSPDWRGRIAFLLLSLAIGPGLVTNTLLKDQLGRPRPHQLREFGGSASYVAPLIPSTLCHRNCSFPSGHAAAGFWLISGAWIWRRQRRAWLAAGCTAGTLVGLVRIVQGGHFLSDVVGALIVVWLVNVALNSAMTEQGWLKPVAADA